MITLVFVTLAMFSSQPNEIGDSILPCKQVYDSLLTRQYYITADTLPKYPDGRELLYAFIYNNLKFTRSNSQPERKIYVYFIVETDGTLTFVKFHKPQNDVVENEIRRVLKIIPKWIPAKCEAEIVPFLFILPLTINAKL
jgi:hypothetical protein